MQADQSSTLLPPLNRNFILFYKQNLRDRAHIPPETMSALLPLLACLFVPLIIAVEVTPRDFVGKWRLMNSDNFDEYMKAVGEGGGEPAQSS